MYNKETINGIFAINKNLKKIKNNPTEETLIELDKALVGLHENIEEMKKQAIKEIEKSNLQDSKKAYLIRFMNDPNSDIEDLFKITFDEDEYR